MPHLLIRVYRNVWPITLALLVHIVLFSLMSVNLDWTRQLKPAAMQPMQAVAIIESMPEPPAPLPEPEPEPEPEPPKPKPKPKPKPVKTSYAYPCAGKQLEADSAEKAKALQETCEEDERKKKAEEEKKKQEKLDAEKKRKEAERKKKEAEEKQRKEVERKEKEAAEKKRKEAERKKKAAAEKKRKEVERKKKAAAEQKRKDTERKKKAAAEKKRKAQAAQRAKAEKALKAKLDKEGAERAWGAALGGADGSGRAVANHVSSNYRYNPTCVGRNSTWLIEVTPTGQILGITMRRGSGNDTCDREAGLAIKNSNPLPIHVDWPTAKPDKFEFNFRPE